MPDPLKWLWLTVGVVVLDQLTKAVAVKMLVLLQPIEVLPLVNLTLVYNTGMAFSILSDAGGWQRWLLSAIAIGMSAGIIWWLVKGRINSLLLAAALALIAGGAIGNVIDRILLGYVVDFIDVYWASWHWPAFNVADSAISIGAVLLIVDAIRGERGESHA